MGAESFTSDEIADEWRQLDLEHDAWLVVVPEGRLAGYGTLEERGDSRFMSDGYVHPELRGLGVGGMLVDLAEERARERGAVAIHNTVLAADEAATEVLGSRGYTPERHFYRMAIELGDEPPEPGGRRASASSNFARRTRSPSTRRSRTPGRTTGTTGRVRSSSSVRGCSRARATTRRCGRWPGRGTRSRVGRSARPSTTAWAGYVRCQCGDHGGATGSGWRCCRTAFRQFHERGQRQVGLGVDAESPTGATRLYERAGMHVLEATAIYGKELE